MTGSAYPVDGGTLTLREAMSQKPSSFVSHSSTQP
jgi:hypothetical protein